ncbi:uncharacterized protein [Nicotiana sylvestris]|uniref:uncharacterized protein n=1 Tax=Nicotiana sylvestris TaxID=4096 RepID=UPI00388CEAC3
MCAEIEKNKNLQTNLERVKNDLEKFLKWTWSSEATTAIYTNNGGNRQEIGFQREKLPTTLTASTSLFLITALVPIVETMSTLKKIGTVKGSSQQWFMDSGCSKHMTENTMDFLSLKALQGGSVSFGNGKKGYILGVRKVGKSHTHSIEKVYYVNGLKYSLLSVSQICDKGNKKDLVHGLPMSKFKVQKVCDAYTRGKHMKSYFKSKKDMSTSKPLEVLHMDLCGPMRVQSRGGKRYIFVIVDDYSRFTWTLFLKTKYETVEVFVAFVKKIQVKMESRVACISSDHGTEFYNVKFDGFCNKNGITHNFSSPRTPQQNRVV